VGYRKTPTIHTIDDIEGEEGLIVRMQGISFGKVRQITALLGDDSDDGEAMGEIAKLTVSKLVSWNLEDGEGVPVPVTLEGFESQEFDLILKVVNAWLDRMTGVSADLGKGSPSGESFPGQPVTMEAL
jgi:hypothetical protein